jgi:acyl carrier protein
MSAATAGIELRIGQLVGEIVGTPGVALSPETKFSRLGLDSANSVTLLLGLEECIGRELDLERAQTCQTIGELTAYIMSVA